MKSKRAAVEKKSVEAGFALIGTMVILLVITILALSVSNTTNLNHLIATNDKFAKEDFYNQERCSTTAQIDYRTWLTTTFLTDGETSAYFPKQGSDIDGNGTNDDVDAQCFDANGVLIGEYKVRKVESSDTPIGNWDDINDYDSDDDGKLSQEELENHPANQFPVKDHIDKPEPGSGYDQKNFEIRRFLITSYSTQADRNAVIQKGAYKVFNKYD